MTGAPLLTPAGRVVAISGASRGLGRAIAERLHAEGYALSLGVREPDGLVAKLGFDEGRTSAHRYDATDRASAGSWIAQTLARHGRLDGLVNNAGIFRAGSVETSEEDDLDAMWEVNVKGPWRVTRAALPALRASEAGRIVNIASTDGKRVRDHTASLGYVMSKHALVALSHATKHACWEAGVRVTALCPGAIETELIASVPGATPAGNRLDPDTVAETVALLMRLPAAATISELVLNTRLESTL
ncbi:SDR family oxidoreductase [Salinarimonas ramus]|uniref:Agropine synthesis reductase n=1 Tax=Salinarimonas ramus TaxID=690164 RepID=A0A917QIQ0_9HYPH|nr:SDR family NAD(P)-dependent oxidoreductase [Salinarimonas ramus]GGK50851.1 agropine synthesis reductase [Salinarimonas ramus]